MSDGKPVEGPGRLAAPQPLVGRRGTLARDVRDDGDDRVHRGIDALDLREMSLEQLDCGELPLTEKARLLHRGQEADVGHATTIGPDEIRRAG